MKKKAATRPIVIDLTVERLFVTFQTQPRM